MTEPTKSASWRDLIKVHPAAELFPRMSDAELQALGEDIKANGLSAPITLTRENGKLAVLDGRNRLDAMEAIGFNLLVIDDKKNPEYSTVVAEMLDAEGLSAHFTTWKNPLFDGDPYTFVVSANIHRRHLTTDQRKAIAEELLKANPARSDRSIAKDVGISPTTVGTIRERVEPEPATVQSGQLEQEPAKRIGRDGKARKMPASRKAAKTEEQVEVQTAAKEQPMTTGSPDHPQAKDGAEDEDGFCFWEDPRHNNTNKWILDYCDLRSRYPHKSRNAFKILFTSRLLSFDEALDAFKAWYAALTTSERARVEEAIEQQADAA